MNNAFYYVKAIATPDNTKSIYWRLNSNFSTKGKDLLFYVDRAKSVGDWECLNPHDPLKDVCVFIDREQSRYNKSNNVFYRVRMLVFDSIIPAPKQEITLDFEAYDSTGALIASNFSDSLYISPDGEYHDFSCHCTYLDRVIYNIKFNSNHPTEDISCNDNGIFVTVLTKANTIVTIPFAYSKILNRWLASSFFHSTAILKITTAICEDAYTMSSDSTTTSQSSSEFTSHSSNTYTTSTSVSNSSDSTTSVSSSSDSTTSDSSDSSTSDSSDSSDSTNTSSEEITSEDSSSTEEETSSDVVFVDNSYSYSSSTNSSSSSYDGETYIEYSSNPTQLAGSLSDRGFLIAKSMLRGMYQSLKKGGGIQGFLLKKKEVGEHCSLCTDNDLGNVVNQHCEECYGTGIIGGYHEGLEFWILPQTQNSAKKLTEVGILDNNSITAECAAYPWISTFDVWVEAQSNDRYVIEKIIGILEVERKPIVIRLSLSKITTTAVEQNIPIVDKTEEFINESMVDYTIKQSNIIEDFPTKDQETIRSNKATDNSWRTGLMGDV